MNNNNKYYIRSIKGGYFRQIKRNKKYIALSSRTFKHGIKSFLSPPIIIMHYHLLSFVSS